MSNIIVPQRRIWTRQPDWENIDWSSLAVKAHGVWVPGLDRVMQTRQFGLLAPAGSSTFGYTYGVDSGRVYRQSSSDGNFVSFRTSSNWLSTNKPQSILIVASASAANATGHTACALRDDYSSAQTSVRIDFGDVTNARIALKAFNTSGTGFLTSSDADFVANKPYAILARVTPSVQTLVIDGVIQSAVGNSFTGTLPAVSATYILGNRYHSDTSKSVRVYLCASFESYLSDAESIALTRNPWQIFYRRPRRTIIDLGANGSGITINTTPALSVATGINSAVSTDITITTATASGVSSGLSANLTSEISIPTNVAISNAIGITANISSNITVQTIVAAGVASGSGATISTDTGTINCGVGIGASSSVNAIVTSNISISTGLGVGVATGLGSNVTTEQSVSSSIAAALTTGLPANVISDITIQTGYAHGSGLGLVATIVEDEIVPLTQEQLDQALAYIKANPMILTIPKYIALKDMLNS